jgi:hypothetical protein
MHAKRAASTTRASSRYPSPRSWRTETAVLVGGHKLVESARLPNDRMQLTGSAPAGNRGPRS